MWVKKSVSSLLMLCVLCGTRGILGAINSTKIKLKKPSNEQTGTKREKEQTF